MKFVRTIRRVQSRRSQAGFSTISGLLAVASSAGLGGLVLMSGDEQVAAAEITVCQFDKTTVMTAVEADYAANFTGRAAYAEPAGEDGFDNVRADGWMRTESKYWQYLGVDDTNTPQYKLRMPVEGCE